MNVGYPGVGISHDRTLASWNGSYPPLADVGNGLYNRLQISYLLGPFRQATDLLDRQLSVGTFYLIVQNIYRIRQNRDRDTLAL